jgi:hypothetical protein
MSSALAEQIREMPSRREPPYRPQMLQTDAERAALAKKLGDAANYETQLLRVLVAEAPENIEFRKALVSGIVSAEYAGIDAFSRKVCEWQTWSVPWELIMAMARQTWDEVRHAQLGTRLLESYGGVLGEYPDTLAGSSGAAAGGPAGAGRPGGMMAGQAQEVAPGDAQGNMRDPLISLAVTNVALEGQALDLFRGTSELGHKVGDDLMELVYDYNWADEVTHTAIGDYFVKGLCEAKPGEEQRALRAHAMFEANRARLSGDQVEEIKAFFAEEVERGNLALAGSGPARPAGY